MIISANSKSSDSSANGKMFFSFELLNDVADLEGWAQFESQVFHHHIRGEEQ
jgi:hypothetical protein